MSALTDKLLTEIEFLENEINNAIQEGKVISSLSEQLKIKRTQLLKATSLLNEGTSTLIKG